jgi:hypothetical protein
MVVPTHKIPRVYSPSLTNSKCTLIREFKTFTIGGTHRFSLNEKHITRKISMATIMKMNFSIMVFEFLLGTLIEIGSRMLVGNAI